MQVETVFKALAHKNRLRILNLINNRELCVCELENIMGTTQSNVSRHLGKLKDADIISPRRDAQWIYYALNDEFIQEHSFLQKVIQEELVGQIFDEDMDRLQIYMESNLNCSDLREGREIFPDN